MKSFLELLRARWEKGLFLCVGLDADFAKIPECLKKGSLTETLFEFNLGIIGATAGYCCAFKPNIAFYEGYGPEGLAALRKTTAMLRDDYPEIPVILDAKRADIGNTNNGYLKAVEEVYRAHAVTVHPYLGKEALKPFLDRPDLGVIVLCHTSNPGAGEFQELKVDRRELYLIVADRVNREWNYNNNCGLVVGATFPEQLREVRKIAPEMPLLIPGIGAQGGDLALTVANSLDRRGRGIIINVSRGIIYASRTEDFAAAAGNEAAKLAREITAQIELVLK